MPEPEVIDRLIVRATGKDLHDGRIEWAGERHRCALGRGGVTETKIEGDGATPVGSWPVRRAFYRADRHERPHANLPLHAINAHDGWCDAPDHPAYNRLIEFPFAASAERLWRSDHLYDYIVELGYNDDPPVAGKGSAIFFHLCRDDFGPTEGCIAVPPPLMRRILRSLSKDAILIVERPV